MKQHKFKVNGLTLNCLDYGGEGNPPILFLHGGSAHAHWWDFVGPHFTGRYHALSLDQRGHGDSEWPPDWAYGTRHYAEDLEALIDSWGLGAPVLIGHSMGAHNTLVAATRYPQKLRAIAAIDTPPDYSQRAVDFLKYMSQKPARRYETFEEAVSNFRLLPRETAARKDILEHAARHTFKPTADGGWTHKLDRRTMIREPLDTWDDLGKITCPALVIKLLRSPVFDREAAKKMAAAMPRGKYAEIDSYHHVTFDDPQRLVAVLDQFLKEIE